MSDRRFYRDPFRGDAPKDGGKVVDHVETELPHPAFERLAVSIGPAGLKLGEDGTVEITGKALTFLQSGPPDPIEQLARAIFDRVGLAWRMTLRLEHETLGVVEYDPHKFYGTAHTFDEADDREIRGNVSALVKGIRYWGRTADGKGAYE